MKFWPSRSPGRGLRRGENFWLRLTTASAQCLHLSSKRFFIIFYPRYRGSRGIWKTLVENCRSDHYSNTKELLLLLLLLLPAVFLCNCVTVCFRAISHKHFNLALSNLVHMMKVSRYGGSGTDFGSKSQRSKSHGSKSVHTSACLCRSVTALYCDSPDGTTIRCWTRPWWLCHCLLTYSLNTAVVMVVNIIVSDCVSSFAIRMFSSHPKNSSQQNLK